MRRLAIWVLTIGCSVGLAGCPSDKDGGANTGGGTAGGETASATQNATPVDLSKAGTIKGTVKFEGKPPRRKKVLMSGDEYCGTVYQEPPLDEKVIVGPNGEFANVLVYVSKGLGNWKYDPPKGEAVLDQKGCLYHPHVIAVRAGQKVLIKNDDKTTHNVHPTPKKNPEWNKGQQAGDGPIEAVFKQPEIGIPIGCDIHSWMLAYIHVLDHPYFAVTGTDGTFQLPKIPAGTYTLTAWHEKYGTVTADVEVKENAESDVTLTFKKK